MTLNAVKRMNVTFGSTCFISRRTKKRGKSMFYISLPQSNCPGANTCFSRASAPSFPFPRTDPIRDNTNTRRKQHPHIRPAHTRTNDHHDSRIQSSNTIIMPPTLYPRPTLKKIIKAHANRSLSKNVDILVRTLSSLPPHFLSISLPFPLLPFPPAVSLPQTNIVPDLSQLRAIYARVRISDWN